MSIELNGASPEYLFTSKSGGIAGKNILLNGAAEIWARGTSFTTTGYCADRWYGTISGTATIAQETVVVPVGFKNAIKWTTGAAASYGQLRQFIESANVFLLRGQTVTASAYVQLGTSFSGTLGFEIGYSTITDSITGGSYTVIPSVTTGTSVIGSYTKITATFTVPLTSVGLYVGIVPSVAQATGINAYQTGIQLELSPTATPFSRAASTYDNEIAACKRFYFRIGGAAGLEQFGWGTTISTTQIAINIPHPVDMRIPPTAIDYNLIRAVQYNTTGAVTYNVASAPTLNAPGTQSTLLIVTVVGFVMGYSAWIDAQSSSGYLGLSSELV